MLKLAIAGLVIILVLGLALTAVVQAKGIPIAGRVCLVHKGALKHVQPNAVKAHLAHGDEYCKMIYIPVMLRK
jgi:hypothetical protein